MDVANPGFRPDASLDRDGMEDMQRELAAAARFEDDGGLDPTAIEIAGPVDQDDPAAYDPAGGPVVVGVDQAFREDHAVSAAVAVQDGAVVASSAGRASLDLPYIPGLLAFREAPAIVDALDSLDVPPDVLVLDGSGRIHYRQAGIAVHVGVLYDVPAVGVAKRLLCGQPRSSLEDPLAAGTRVAIDADAAVDAPAGTVIGYAFQSRQYPNPSRRHVNPLFVSPGHRLSAETAVDVVAATCGGYKLPEPTRLADRRANELKR